MDLGQIARAEKGRQLAGVTTIGLHPITRFARHQGGSNHHAIEPRLSQTPTETESRGTRFIAHPQEFRILMHIHPDVN
jgi:hypothetical protein